MYQYDSKSKTQSNKSKENTIAPNKEHEQIKLKMPTQTKSLLTPSFNQANDSEKSSSNYVSRIAQLMPLPYSPLQMQLMPNQERREIQPLPLKMNENQEKLAPISVKPNNTGIPLQMKQKFENLSGFSFDDVKVHYNSDKPTQLQALAYTQGNQVYIAPKQEKHLGHELGHVVQQKQNRVMPTATISGYSINSSSTLEREADLGIVQRLKIPTGDAIDDFLSGQVIQLAGFEKNGLFVASKDARTFSNVAMPEAVKGTLHHIIPMNALNQFWNVIALNDPPLWSALLHELIQANLAKREAAPDTLIDHRIMNRKSLSNTIEPVFISIDYMDLHQLVDHMAATFDRYRQDNDLKSLGQASHTSYLDSIRAQIIECEIDVTKKTRGIGALDALALKQPLNPHQSQVLTDMRARLPEVQKEIVDLKKLVNEFSKTEDLSKRHFADQTISKIDSAPMDKVLGATRVFVEHAPPVSSKSPIATDPSKLEMKSAAETHFQERVGEVLAAIYQWLPGNLAEGPKGAEREHDPGSGFDKEIAASMPHRAALDDGYAVIDYIIKTWYESQTYDSAAARKAVNILIHLATMDRQPKTWGVNPPSGKHVVTS